MERILLGYKRGPPVDAAMCQCGLACEESQTKEALNKLIPLMVRQAHHERNQQVVVRPELVEGLVQRFPKAPGKRGLVLSVRWWLGEGIGEARLGYFKQQ